MNNDRDYIELVEKAQVGNKKSLDDLAELVRGRLYSYVYRIVLEEDLAQDIVQESMLEMIKSIGNLEEAERFWPWLRKIAFNRINRYYLKTQRFRTVSISKLPEGDWSAEQLRFARTGIGVLIGQELKQIIFNAMWDLKPRHRAVLSMRCYEDMGYDQIAELMGSTELNVRVLFYRAKKALHRRLSRRGYGKGALLTVLALFGKMTAPSEAAAAEVTVTGGSAGVGVAASLVGTVTSRTSLLALTAVGVLSVSSVVAPSWVEKTVSLADKTAIVIREKLSREVSVSTSAGTDIEEYWYYYPQGAKGPVMIRQVKLSSQGRQFCCRRLGNDVANYYFDQQKNAIYIENSHMWDRDLTVRRLPTDKAKLRDFLSMVEGRTKAMEYVSSGGDGLLAIVKREGNRSHLRTAYHYNVLDEEYFRYDWPTGAEVVDNRDAMHKRGWTYFRISGEINGEEVTGVGRIPFVYSASKDASAWLKLKVGDGLKIIDGIDGGRVYDYRRGRFPTYPAYSFFNGLTRPWMGLHSIDTVRRDAAEEEMWFETSYMEDSGKAEVILTKENNTLIYTIDMKRDVIEKIGFSAGGRRGGELRFSYLQDVEKAGDEFAEPRVKDSVAPREEGLGVLWLLKLVEDSLY
ncbi:MAG: RNA polymerase sigma factor [Planctomycetota bacterium]|nr:MAG: RNA polymerase sigma factor [Planctomycetota bacterium]